MKNHYIQATIDLLLAGTDPQVVLSGLQKSMEQKGHMRLYAPVLRGVLRVLETTSDTQTATVYVSKAEDAQTLASQIKEMLAAIDAGDDFSVEVDETLIGGAVATYNNTIIDRSFKTALTNLYRATLR